MSEKVYAIIETEISLEEWQRTEIDGKKKMRIINKIVDLQQKLQTKAAESEPDQSTVHTEEDTVKAAKRLGNGAITLDSKERIDHFRKIVSGWKMTIGSSPF
ncbi:hypothetical protein LOTGIDRAFT_163149 [Lottia gigantea]|uniref:Uncharacterized protein n=1 Tax=Lottia gigantea TaxID=225164 RepID=V3ZKD8_LOTGI|nr:hypothetical protein LOTGIDRAFT_163149 [Lottia gigantea]ESO91788.1 hypothetical protein LOTGIDRAFT_163149 [Lottia gigantea]